MYNLCSRLTKTQLALSQSFFQTSSVHSLGSLLLSQIQGFNQFLIVFFLVYLSVREKVCCAPVQGGKYG
jgi:hypothetical protein